jgi:DNA-binding Lrp family transcriptional regulator
MITIEGTSVKARVIPRDMIISFWKMLTTKPFPKVTALQLEDKDFNDFVKQIKCADDERREIKEWGRVLPTKGTDACVYRTAEFADVDYIILIRENSYHRLGEVLKHELSHIVRGDL